MPHPRLGLNEKESANPSASKRKPIDQEASSRFWKQGSLLGNGWLMGSTAFEVLPLVRPPVLGGMSVLEKSDFYSLSFDSE